jgi:hypothetical protein
MDMRMEILPRITWAAQCPSANWRPCFSRRTQTQHLCRGTEGPSYLYLAPVAPNAVLHSQRAVSPRSPSTEVGSDTL